jgi:exosome complex exonuclease DIS3/RRP44
LSSQNQSQQCGSVVFHSFDPVTVRLSLDTTNIQHEKLVFQLLKPFIEGFSVLSADAMETDQVQGELDKTKRKQQQGENKSSAKKKKN